MSNKVEDFINFFLLSPELIGIMYLALGSVISKKGKLFPYGILHITANFDKIDL